MQPSSLLTLLASATFVASSHAFKVSHDLAGEFKTTCSSMASTSKRGLMEKRACHWGSCEQCYAEEPICQVCNEPDFSDPSGGLAACLVWYVVPNVGAMHRGVDADIGGRSVSGTARISAARWASGTIACDNFHAWPWRLYSGSFC
jgi:hypothetical protein